MAKYYGAIGFCIIEMKTKGVAEETIVERMYSGDILRKTSKWSNGDWYTDNLTFSNQISILADSFAYENIGAMRYITIFGTKWKISSIDAGSRPRLILITGEIYNEG